MIYFEIIEEVINYYYLFDYDSKIYVPCDITHYENGKPILIICPADMDELLEMMPVYFITKEEKI